MVKCKLYDLEKVVLKLFGMKIALTIKDCLKKLGLITNKDWVRINSFELLSAELCEKKKSQGNTFLTTTAFSKIRVK